MSICTELGSQPTVQTLFFCGAEGLFSFDAILTSIALIGLIAVMAWKLRIPPLFSLLCGFVLLYSMDLIFGTNDTIKSMMLLSLLGIGVFIALNVLEYYKNYTR